MGITVRADLVFRSEILLEAIQGEFAGVKALWGTSALIANSSLPGGLEGGDKIKVPRFSTLGEFEDADGETDAIVPSTLEMDSDEADVIHSRQMFEMSKFAELAANYADPYREGARQLLEAATRRFDRAAITEAATTSLSVDVAVGSGTKKLLDWDTMIDAQTKFSDEQSGMALLVVHPHVLADMKKLKDSTGRPLLVDMMDGALPRFAGVPVGTSARLPVDETVSGYHKYTSLLLKAGALALWYNGAPEILEDIDISKNTKLAAVHIYFVVHRYRRLRGSTLTGVTKIITNSTQA